jgi:hypothetical protein
MSAQIKCETFAHKHQISKNNQQKFQIVAPVPTAQNFANISSFIRNSLFMIE